MRPVLRKFTSLADVPSEPVVETVDDGAFGVFTLTGHWHPRSVAVTGPWGARLTLESRAPGPRSLARLVPPPRIVPTRRHAVALAVDVGETALDCGRRALRRGTFDVRATVAERGYHLHHTGLRSARLQRDAVDVASLTRPREARGLSATMAYEQSADVIDATVAVTLGTVLGAGAPGFLRSLLRTNSGF